MLAMVARGGGAGGVSCFSLPGWATGPCVGDGITSMRRGRINIWQKADGGPALPRLRRVSTSRWLE